MTELLDEVHIVWLHGQCFLVDAVTRKEIEAHLQSGPGPTDFIVVDTLLGEELTVIGQNVGAIYSNSAATRTLERAYQKVMHDEESNGGWNGAK